MLILGKLCQVHIECLIGHSDGNSLHAHYKTETYTLESLELLKVFLIKYKTKLIKKSKREL